MLKGVEGGNHAFIIMITRTTTEQHWRAVRRKTEQGEVR
jgi:hypothetical protein